MVDLWSLRFDTEHIVKLEALCLHSVLIPTPKLLFSNKGIDVHLLAIAHLANCN